MLRALRLKLALLYFVSALGIVVLLAAGTYIMLNRFFIQQVDLALQYKMAAQFKLYGLSLPAELENAENLWLDENPHATQAVLQTPVLPSFTAMPEPSPTATKRPMIVIGSGNHESDGEDDERVAEIEGNGEIQLTQEPVALGVPEQESGELEATPHLEEDIFDGRLSSIFIVPVSTPIGAITGARQIASPIVEDVDASIHALAFGYDLRTVRLSDETNARLLTYRTNGSGIPTVIQIGRLLDDQDRLLQLYLIGLLLLGFIASLMISILSWYLSGRSIKPAQKAWDQQQLFISNASHELRTPLTLIRANADYAIRSGKPQAQVTALNDVLGEVDYMNHLVDDLLLLSRLDTHRLVLDRKELNVDLLLREISRQATVIARNRGVRIVNRKTGCVIAGDPNRIRQVILSLIDNALRFTPPGGVIEMGAVQKAGMIDLYVRDNGSGIAPEHLEKLFERFYQVPGSNVPETRNNGLGLSIAKALVEAQGGKIRIETQVGQGATVWLSMPPK
jgi:two-component system sensor histidine kinase CiaH